MATMIEGATRLRRTLRDEDGASYHGVGVYTVQSVASSGEASTVAKARIALFTALRADSALNTALRAPTAGDTTSLRVFHDLAPVSTPLNYITLGDGGEAEGDTTSYDAIGVDDEILFDVWGVPSTGRWNIESLYAHCARVLHGQRLVLT